MAWCAVWLLLAAVALGRGRMLLVTTIRRLSVMRLLAWRRPAVARVGRLLVLLMRRAIVMLSLLIRVLASIAWVWGVALLWMRRRILSVGGLLLRWRILAVALGRWWLLIVPLRLLLLRRVLMMLRLLAAIGLSVSWRLIIGIWRSSTAIVLLVGHWGEG